MDTSRMWMLGAMVLLQACAATDGDADDDTDSSEDAVNAGASAWRSEAQLATATQRQLVLDDFTRRCTADSFQASAPLRGARYTIRFHRCSAEGSAKGTFVIVPGTTESSVRYAELAWDWTRRGYELLIMNNRGEGFNQRLLPDDPATPQDESQRRHMERFDDYVSDLRDFAALAARTAAAPDRMMLVCHSMGGGICSRYVEVVPANPFKGVMLSAPMQGIQIALHERAIIEGGEHVVPERWVPGGGPYNPREPFDGNTLTSSANRFAMRHFVNGKFKEIQLGGATFGWVERALEATRRIQADAGRIKTPMLILSARADSIVDPSSHEKVCGAITRAGGTCELLKLEGARHEVFIESDAVRNRAFDAMARFTQKHAPAR